MQPRRIARELALLSLSQLPKKASKLSDKQLGDVVVAAVRTMTAEATEALESAVSELKQGHDRLESSQHRADDLKTARLMVSESIELTQKAIEQVGTALELPEFVQLANQEEVRRYALQLLSTVNEHRADIDATISAALVDWQLDRLPHIDSDVLRLAVAEIEYLDTPERVVVNEAVELVKRYSSEDAHRFVNGVLRRALDLRANAAPAE
ncbi:MAG: transcription antitermination factor NusB [Geitlerinemataceae cyanobacterium]